MFRSPERAALSAAVGRVVGLARQVLLLLLLLLLLQLLLLVVSGLVSMSSMGSYGRGVKEGTKRGP